MCSWLWHPHYIHQLTWRLEKCLKCWQYIDQKFGSTCSGSLCVCVCVCVHIGWGDTSAYTHDGAVDVATIREGGGPRAGPGGAQAAAESDNVNWARVVQHTRWGIFLNTYPQSLLNLQCFQGIMHTGSFLYCVCTVYPAKNSYVIQITHVFH